MPADSNLDVRLRLRADSSELVRGLSRSERAMRRLARVGGTVSQSLGRVAGSWRTWLVGLGAVAGIRALVNATVRQEQALARVDVRLRGIGDATQLTTRGLADMAAELQRVTTFGDEAILEAQGLLLTFENLREADTALFGRATETVLDLAAAMGTDLRSAAIALAKALDDPARGLDGLSRSGTTFTKEQQSVIRSLFETGREAEAMGFVLDRVDSQVGGTAEAMRDTLGGALDSLGNAWGDLLEQSSDTETLRIEIERITAALSSREAADNARAIGDAVAGIGGPGRRRATASIGLLSPGHGWAARPSSEKGL